MLNGVALMTRFLDEALLVCVPCYGADESELMTTTGDAYSADRPP